LIGSNCAASEPLQRIHRTNSIGRRVFAKRPERFENVNGEFCEHDTETVITSISS
jgi:hypothetical protein